MYSKGIIYKIICNLDNNICYIGSTFNQLKQRWQGHKNNFKCWLKNKDVIGGRCSIFKYYEKYGIENFTIIKIKEYLVYRDNNKDRRHLLVYEQLWINRTKCINTDMAFALIKRNKITNVKYISYDKGFTKQSKENVKQKYKQYWLDNKENIKQKRRTIINCDCGGKYQVNNKWSHIKTDKHKKKQSKEYQDNKVFTKQSKEERLIKRRTIINCDCGGKYQVNNKWSHIKTDKHKNNLNISKKETI